MLAALLLIGMFARPNAIVIDDDPEPTKAAMTHPVVVDDNVPFKH